MRKAPAAENTTSMPTNTTMINCANDPLHVVTAGRFASTIHEITNINAVTTIDFVQLEITSALTVCGVFRCVHHNRIAA